MRRSITKEQITQTALEIMRNKNDLQSLNLREIARTLGCAHTNLYNYFPSYNDLLWDAHAALMDRLTGMLIAKLDSANSSELQLSYFFSVIVDMYLDNKGWFWLAWHEYIEGDRPQRDIEATEMANQILNKHLSDIWKDVSGENLDTNAVKRTLHNVHCYIVGEVSNYILGRGLIQNEEELKRYVSHEAIRIFKLCIKESDMIEL